MKDRSAVDTIRGYFYQFDYSILKLLQLSNIDDSITVENIEDVDIKTATEITAVQCKYYAGSEYNHSVIKPAIMFMLSHFKDSKNSGKPVTKYSLYGHYSKGQNKLVLPLKVEFLKQHFLTYKEKKVEKFHHLELGLSDSELSDFLSVLDIDIQASSFEDQFDKVILALQAVYSCTPFTAEFFYYNNALALMRELSIQPLSVNRTITKKEFLARSDTSSVLFNDWFVQKKGKKPILPNCESNTFQLSIYLHSSDSFLSKLTQLLTLEVISKMCSICFQKNGLKRLNVMEHRHFVLTFTFAGYPMKSWFQ